MGPGFRPEPLPPRCMEPARLARSWAVQFRAGLNILTFCNTARNPEVRYCVILMPIRPSLPPRLSRPAKRIVAHAPLSHPEFSLPCRPCGCRSHGGSPGPPPRRRADPQRAPAQLAQSRQRRPGRRAGEPRQPLRPDRVLYGPAAVAEHARPLRGECPARPDWRPLHRGAQSDRSRRLRRAELPALKIGVRTCRAGYGTSRRRTLDLYKLIRDGLLRPSSGTLTWTYVGSSERVGSTVIRSSWATSAGWMRLYYITTRFGLLDRAGDHATAFRRSALVVRLPPGPAPAFPSSGCFRLRLEAARVGADRHPLCIRDAHKWRALGAAHGSWWRRLTG